MQRDSFEDRCLRHPVENQWIAFVCVNSKAIRLSWWEK